MDAPSFISATSNVNSDDDLPEHLNNLTIPPAISHILKVLVDHLGDEIDIAAFHPQIGV